MLIVVEKNEINWEFFKHSDDENWIRRESENCFVIINRETMELTHKGYNNEIRKLIKEGTIVEVSLLINI